MFSALSVVPERLVQLFTNNAMLAVDEHGWLSVPVTEYMNIPAMFWGKTRVGFVELLFHKYVIPPLAVMVTLSPLHDTVLVAEIVMVGLFNTLTVTVNDALQPF